MMLGDVPVLAKLQVICLNVYVEFSASMVFTFFQTIFLSTLNPNKVVSPELLHVNYLNNKIHYYYFMKWLIISQLWFYSSHLLKY